MRSMMDVIFVPIALLLFAAAYGFVESVERL
jgi:hypothetical protein